MQLTNVQAFHKHWILRDLKGQLFAIHPDKKLKRLNIRDRHRDLVYTEEIACGKDHFVSVDSLGKLYGWGSSAYGELGGNPKITISEPQEGNYGHQANIIERGATV